MITFYTDNYFTGYHNIEISFMNGRLVMFNFNADNSKEYCFVINTLGM